MKTQKEIVIAKTSLSRQVGIHSIKDAFDHILVSHLVRNLVAMDSEEQLQGDLAKSWTISSDFKTYEFELLPNQKWSNNTIITCKDYLRTLIQLQKVGKTIHYDFSKIASVSCRNETLVISLKEPDPFFLYMLSYPDFGLVSLKDDADSLAVSDYAISSGPYTLEKKFNHHEMVLHLNSNYPFRNLKPFEKITVREVQKENNEAPDIFWPDSSLSKERHEKILSEYELTYSLANIGFSYWIAINADLPELQSLEVRRCIQKLISEINFDLSHEMPIWERANQLYVDASQGRPTQEELDHFWNSVRKSRLKPLPSSLTFLAFKDLPGLKQIVERFSEIGVHVELTTYETQSEYANLIKNKKYHLIQNNNDYSSLELYENLFVSLNPHRPLIFAGAQQQAYLNHLKEALTNDYEKRFQVYKDIGLSLLKEAYIVPLFYNKFIVYHKPGLDFKAWQAANPMLYFHYIKQKN